MRASAVFSTHTVTRRSLVRTAVIGSAGLAAATLLGCGGGKSTPGSPTPSSSAASSNGSSGAPKNVKRADGFDPRFGTIPVNQKKVVMGGTYRRSRNDTSRQNDPDVSIAGADFELIGDRLAYANGFTAKVTPDMLASYEVTDKSGLAYVFKLRPGIKTHDRPPVNGRVFTAKDVAYSIKRKAGLLDPKLAASKYARYAQYIGVTDAIAVDDVTIQVKLSRPNGSLIPALADPRAQMIPVEQDDIGYKDPMKLVGTGAFYPTAYVDGTRQTFKAFDQYYRQWDDGGRPGIDTYEDVVIPDRGGNVAAFLSGQIDTLSAIQPQEEPQVRASKKDAQWSLTPGPTWDHFAVNLKLPMFQDDRVRQAFQLVIDYKAFSDPLGDGWKYTGPLHAMYPEAIPSEAIAKMPGYNPATKEQDVANAVKLMDAAGHHDGEGMSWTQVNSGPVTDSNVRIKEMLNKVWPKINIVIQPIGDYAQFTNLLNSRTFEARVYNHTCVPDVVGDWLTYYYTKGGRNYQSYSKDWADALLEKVLAAQTLQERTDLVQQFEKRYIEEGPPLLQLRIPPDNLAHAAQIAGNDLVAGPWAYNSYKTTPRWIWRTV